MTERSPVAEGSLTLDSLLAALGSAVVSVRAAPTGTRRSIRSVSLFDADDLATVESGVLGADLCVLAGVSAHAARRWSTICRGWIPPGDR